MILFLLLLWIILVLIMIRRTNEYFGSYDTMRQDAIRYETELKQLDSDLKQRNQLYETILTKKTQLLEKTNLLPKMSPEKTPDENLSMFTSELDNIDTLIHDQQKTIRDLHSLNTTFGIEFPSIS